MTGLTTGQVSKSLGLAGFNTTHHHKCWFPTMPGYVCLCSWIYFCWQFPVPPHFNWQSNQHIWACLYKRKTPVPLDRAKCLQRGATRLNVHNEIPDPESLGGIDEDYSRIGFDLSWRLNKLCHHLLVEIETSSSITSLIQMEHPTICDIVGWVRPSNSLDLE